MRTEPATRTGFLTVFSADGREVYGEFADADWAIEEARLGTNHVFSGIAGEGTMDTFQRINAEGINHVTYAFDTGGQRYSGPAQLLAPEESRMPGQALIRIETTVSPHAA